MISLGRTRTRRARFLRAALPVAVVLGLSACATAISREALAVEYIAIGNAWFELGNLAQSQTFYLRAIDLGADLAAARFNLARVYIDLGRYEDALAVLDAMEPSGDEVRLVAETRAWVLYRLGREDEARTLYRAILAQSPAETRAAYNLALLELSSDRPDAAWDAVAPTLIHADNDREFQWLAAEAAYESGRTEAALVRLETVRALNDGAADALQLASRYRDWSYNLAAIDVLEAWMEEAELSSDGLFLLAGLYLRATPDFREGREMFERAIDAGFRDGTAVSELLVSLVADEALLLAGYAREAGITVSLDGLAPSGEDSQSSDGESGQPDEAASEELPRSDTE